MEWAPRARNIETEPVEDIVTLLQGLITSRCCRVVMVLHIYSASCSQPAWYCIRGLAVHAMGTQETRDLCSRRNQENLARYESTGSALHG